MKRQRSSSGAKTFHRQSWQFQRSWLAQISQPRWEYARSGAAERRRCIGRNDNVIGWIRIFPFWVVDPERLRCRAEPCKEKRGTPFSVGRLARFRKSLLEGSPYRCSCAGCVLTVVDFLAVPHGMAKVSLVHASFFTELGIAVSQ